jgi:hypothetical protein
VVKAVVVVVEVLLEHKGLVLMVVPVAPDLLEVFIKLIMVAAAAAAVVDRDMVEVVVAVVVEVQRPL